MLNIGSRLLCVASMVQPHRKTVDIGTDHAYLPAYLVLNGIAEDVLACDIGVMPLQNAKKTVESFSLQDSISLRISDGLKNVLPEEAQEITVCGMGGVLMVEILNAAPWIKRDDMHLVLQPMTHSEDVRRYLCENGFSIKEEKCVIDNKKVYCCISAFYTGCETDIDDGFCYFGFLPTKDEITKEYVEKQYHRLTIKLNALEISAGETPEVKKLKRIKRYYEERVLK